MSCDVGKATEGLKNELWRRQSDRKVGEWALLILQTFHHSSFSNPSVTLPTSQLILQPFHCFTYVTDHYPSFLSLHLRHSSFSNHSLALTMSQLILQPFPSFTFNEQAHSPTFPSLHLRHNSFSNPSVALPASQLILQAFSCFTYVTAHSPTLLSLLLRHKFFI